MLTIGLWLEVNVKLYQTLFFWNNLSWKINSQESMVGFLKITKQEDKSMNAVVNQWLEASMLWVLVLVLLRLLISHHTRDLDYSQQSTRLIHGMENLWSSRLTELMFGRHLGISKPEVPISVDKVFGLMVSLVLMKSLIIKLLKLKLSSHPLWIKMLLMVTYLYQYF